VTLVTLFGAWLVIYYPVGGSLDFFGNSGNSNGTEGVATTTSTGKIKKFLERKLPFQEENRRNGMYPP
jgi:hypothetical protein